MEVTAGPVQSWSDSDHDGTCSDDESSDFSHSTEVGTGKTEEVDDPLSVEVLQLLEDITGAWCKGSKRKLPTVKGLYKQLKSLRSVVPYCNSSRKSCVIADALKYKEQLRSQIQTLRTAMQLGAPKSNLNQERCSGQVEVTTEGLGIQIHISCEKKPGLMVALVEGVERLGLVLERANVSCNDDITMHAFANQEIGGATMDAAEIRRTLLGIIGGVSQDTIMQ